MRLRREIVLVNRGNCHTGENVDKLTEAGEIVVSEVVFEYRTTVVKQKYARQSHHPELSVQRMMLVTVNRVKSRNRKID